MVRWHVNVTGVEYIYKVANKRWLSIACCRSFIHYELISEAFTGHDRH